MVRLLGLRQIPMLFVVGPRVMRLDDECCEVLIPLNYVTRNHMKSMYIGVLTAGADLAGGLPAAMLIWGKHKKVQLIFKDFHADFLKRPDADVLFTCNDVRKIREAVEQADESGERVNLPVEIVASVASEHGSEEVAKFSLGLSLKRKSGA